MKFKRVEIQAFKSYLHKQDGTFDFTVQGDTPADIISIYAPNGFGKTSFYDAIDYCMTNNITRYIRDPSLANNNNSDAKELNQSGQKQHILRTKSAPEDIESVIKITTNKGSIERNVSPARNGSKDYRFDDKNTKPEERYFRSVMLSQEAIDSFLKELKPESRYKEFMAQQLGGDDSHEQDRQQIQLMLGKINNRLEKIKIEINKIESKKELAENSIDLDCLKNINLLASDLNDKGANFPEFDTSFNKELNEKLKIKISYFWEVLEKNINKSNDDKIQLESLIDSFHIIESKYKEIGSLESEAIKLSKQKDDIEKFAKLKKDKLFLAERQEQHKSFYNKVRSLKERLPEFFDKLKTKNNYSSNLTCLQDSLTNNNKELQVRNSVLEELKRQRNNIQIEINSFEKNKIDSVDYFSKIDSLELEISKNDLSKIESRRNQLKDNILELKSKGIEVKKLTINDLDYIISSKSNNDKLQCLSKEYSSLNFEKEKLVDKLSELNRLLESSKLQENSISDLIRIGFQLINENQDQHCPLCQHKYDSFSQLADTINSNSILSDSQQRILREIEECQYLLKNREYKIKLLSDEFNAEKENYLISLRESLQLLIKEKTSISEKIDNINNYQSEVNRLKYLVLNKNPLEYKIHIDGLIRKSTKSSDLIEKQINDTELECEFYIEQEKNLKIDFAKVIGQVDNQENLLSDDLLLLLDLNVSRELIEPKIDKKQLKLIINSEFNRQKKLYFDIDSDIKINDYAITDLLYQYTSDFFNEPSAKSEEIKLNISEVNRELMDLHNFVREFDFVVGKLEVNNLLDENNWEDLKKRFIHEVSSLNDSINKNFNSIEKLELLKNQTNNVLSYIMYINSTDTLVELKEELGKYESIKDALLKDLRKINSALESQINQYFHIDLINTIYRKIDPHPDFKRIDFNCSFPEGGRPKLQVFITDEDGSNTVSPTLSFSAAQINVLSLSIFLAKAIHTMNDDEEVDCIFIDDPVQSMDSINVLGVIDLLRNLSVNLGKQIIISTHDDNFHALLKQKIPEHLFRSKFLELESFGKVAPHAGQ
ncbi:AAA family ATPase [Vibrio sp. IB15]|uniref:AAA family ATPase n=1 Tax=Vibrio sp. IB15 TaxID=2779368 RepID=UPI0018E8405A|nr:AAA family ATPase [Vibrio sp. IB15]MBJ2147937.1 AAA family ATPase [Vibrio sp. IB15]